ncbi:general secretion pathway protein GspB [Alteromonas lipotrueiana]|uniref:general secretion pathway protein GspB n=1 Tax=Alteromonas lipotrueiana TaxID=2803815 RepID=UPI001C46064E|nr:general secretion pathway protein GspB [Alteromonas lipotrueiana]
MSELRRIEELEPGMVIVQITQQNGPVKIRKSGLVTSQSMVHGLAEMGVQEVQIDPSQTVEVEQPVASRTQTQQLLRGDHDTRRTQDTQLSDQFNRSLFLPTLQGLQSPWRRTVKRAGQFVAIAALGLLLGFAGGSASGWWPALWSTQTLIAQADKPLPVAQQKPVRPAPDIAQVTREAAALLTPGPESAQVPTESVSGGQGTADSDTAFDQQNQQQTDTPKQRAQADAESTVKAQTSETDDYAGKVLNKPAQSNNSNVSQELLEKFNKAIDELDSSPADTTTSRESIEVSDTIPRVDELPARLLTRLPAMKFSAHMYASNPVDRWVRVNGSQRGEGDWIADNVQVIKIEGRRVILSFQGEQFSMAALTDW